MTDPIPSLSTAEAALAAAGITGHKTITEGITMLARSNDSLVRECHGFAKDMNELREERDAARAELAKHPTDSGAAMLGRLRAWCVKRYEDHLHNGGAPMAYMTMRDEIDRMRAEAAPKQAEADVPVALVYEPDLLSNVTAQLAAATKRIGELAVGPVAAVLAEIREERRKQEAKWGEQNYDFPKWLVILSEEIGEASREFLHATSEDPANALQRAANMRVELIQVASVAAQIIEAGDRNSWWPDEAALRPARAGGADDHSRGTGTGSTSAWEGQQKGGAP